MRRLSATPAIQLLSGAALSVLSDMKCFEILRQTACAVGCGCTPAVTDLLLLPSGIAAQFFALPKRMLLCEVVSFQCGSESLSWALQQFWALLIPLTCEATCLGLCVAFSPFLVDCKQHACTA
jgi:hypothetical protein